MYGSSESEAQLEVSKGRSTNWLLFIDDLKLSLENEDNLKAMKEEN